MSLNFLYRVQCGLENKGVVHKSTVSKQDSFFEPAKRTSSVKNKVGVLDLS